MPYDELGYFYPALSADQPDEDLMRYELAKKSPPPKPANWDTMKEVPTAENIAYGNYLAAQDALRRESQTKLTTPQGQFMERVVAPWVEPAIALTAGPIAQALSGWETLAKFGATKGLEALGAITPEQRAELLAKTQGTGLFDKAVQATMPKTQAGQENLQAIGEFLTDTLKVPHAWPVAGGMARRPMLTPEDVRAMGGQAAKLKQEIRDIPSDFPNAQQGMVKLDQFGQPTIGAKLGVADTKIREAYERGDIPAPGLAIKPTGGQLMVPKPFGDVIPEVGPQDMRVGNMQIVQRLMDPLDMPIQKQPDIGTLYDSYRDMFLSTNRNQAIAPLRASFVDYSRQRVQQMFPDATPEQANDALNTLYSPDQRRGMLYGWLNDFTKSPETQAAAQALGVQLPTVDEYNARINAARQWIAGPMTQYVQKFVGTEKDPLLQLAEKGITHDAAADLIENVDSFVSNYPTVIDSVRKLRTQLGKDPEGSYKQQIAEKTTELETLQNEYRALNTERRALGEQLLAENPNRDPASDPRYAATTNPISAKEKEIGRIMTELDNLKLADRFELITDASIVPQTAKEVRDKLSYAQKKFFPGIEKIPEEETVYEVRRNALERSGLIDVGKHFVRDVMSGAIPIEQIKNTPIAKFIEQVATTRIKKERDAKLKEIRYVADLQNKLLDDVKSAPRYGNVAVIEISDQMPQGEIARLLSADTEVLDHCVASGGPGGTRKHFLSGKSRNHEPIVNPITGAMQSKYDANNLPGYIRRVEKGDTTIVSIRDTTTGYPVATLELFKENARASNDDIINVLTQNGLEDSTIQTFMTRVIDDGLNNALTWLQAKKYGTDQADAYKKIFDEINALPFEPVYRMGYASGYQNGRIDPQYVKGIADYLNSKSKSIAEISSGLQDSGVYDTLTDMRNLASRLSTSQANVTEAIKDLPRFVTLDEARKAFQEMKARQAQEAPANDPVMQGMITALQAIIASDMRGPFRGETIARDLLLRPELYNLENLGRSDLQSIADMFRQYTTLHADDTLADVTQEMNRRQIIQAGGTPQEIAARLMLNRLTTRFDPTDTIGLSTLSDNLRNRPAMYDLEAIPEDVRAQLINRIDALPRRAITISDLQNNLLGQGTAPRAALPVVGTGVMDQMRSDFDPDNPFAMLYDPVNNAVNEAYMTVLEHLDDDPNIRENPDLAIQELRAIAQNILDNSVYAEQQFGVTTQNQRDVTARYLNSHAQIIEEYLGPQPVQAPAPAQLPVPVQEQQQFNIARPTALLPRNFESNIELEAYRDIMGYVADEIRANELELNDVPANLRHTADMLLSEAPAARGWWEGAFNFENAEQRQNVANVVREHADMIENNLQQQQQIPAQAPQVEFIRTGTEAFDRYFDAHDGFNTPETFQQLVDLLQRVNYAPETLPGVQPQVLGPNGLQELRNHLETTLASRVMDMDPLQYRNLIATSITDMAAATGNYTMPIPMLRLQLYGSAQQLYDDLIARAGRSEDINTARRALEHQLDTIDRQEINLTEYPDLDNKALNLVDEDNFDEDGAYIEVVEPIRNALEQQIRALQLLEHEAQPPEGHARGGHIQNPTLAQMRAEMMLRNNYA